MGRKRPERKNQKLLDLIRQEYQPKTAQDIQMALRDLTAELMEEMLKVELDEHLDYPHGDMPLGLNM